MRLVCGGSTRAQKELWKLDTDRRPQLGVVATSGYCEAFPVSPAAAERDAARLCVPGLALEVRLGDCADVRQAAKTVCRLVEQGASFVKVCS
ncbi:MAG: hypothetical protein U5N86_05675 [Planctomycetota bacterium]|nr:hypothetical protein [Planctomycetota bacterium]